jgi:hypothetical protein
MSTILREDDFQTGQLVTGHSSSRIQITSYGVTHDERLNGKILKIVAINLPYLVAEELTATPGMTTTFVTTMPQDVIFGANQKHIIDTRIQKLMRVSQEFANAILG